MGLDPNGTFYIETRFPLVDSFTPRGVITCGLRRLQIPRQEYSGRDGSKTLRSLFSLSFLESQITSFIQYISLFTELLHDPCCFLYTYSRVPSCLLPHDLCEPSGSFVGSLRFKTSRSSREGLVLWTYWFTGLCVSVYGLRSTVTQKPLILLDNKSSDFMFHLSSPVTLKSFPSSPTRNPYSQSLNSV